MWSDEDLTALSVDQRADLLRQLAVLNGVSAAETPQGRHRRHLLIDLLLVSSVALVPWIVGLVLTLPHHYIAHHWEVAWVGFDLVLLAGLASTAWAAWRRRQIVVLTALVTGTLLVTDAWFDVVTAATTGDFVVSTLTAVFGELPLAAIMFWSAHRVVKLTIRNVRRLAGDVAVDLPLWRVPAFAIDPLPDVPLGHPDP
jgi:hypothetical protein